MQVLVDTASNAILSYGWGMDPSAPEGQAVVEIDESQAAILGGPGIKHLTEGGVALDPVATAAAQAAKAAVAQAAAAAAAQRAQDAATLQAALTGLGLTDAATALANLLGVAPTS